MIHTFDYTYRDKTNYFLWDVESGSLHIVDYPAYLVAKDIYNCLDNQEKTDYKALDAYDIECIRQELLSLEQSGLINMQPNILKSSAKRSDIKALCLHICHDCNLRCKYCFGDEGTYHSVNRDYMSLEVGLKAIDFLLANSADRHSLEVDFFGGEPLMNMDVIKAIVSYAEEKCSLVNKEISFTVTTNGVLLNDDNIDYLNEKMNNVVISIDGRPEIHNEVRKSRNGVDCYDIIMNNAKKFRSKRGDKLYYIRGTFTGLNADFSKDVLYINDMGFDQISIEPVVLDENHSLAIKDHQIEGILKEYEVLSRAYLDRRRNKDSWFNFFHFMNDLDNGPCVTKRLIGCGAGCEYLAISPLGDIYPCHQFVGNEQFKMGNVLDKTFNRTIQDSFMEVNVLTKEDCKKCFAKYYCSGGCLANSFNYEGDINKPYKAGCEMMRKRFELSLAVYAIENLYKDADLNVY